MKTLACPNCHDDLVMVTADFFPQHTQADLYVYNPYMDQDDAPNPGDETSWSGMSRREPIADHHEHMYVPIPVTAWGDYGGSDWGRANWKVLQAEYADVVVFIGSSTHDGFTAALKIGTLIPEYLAERLLGLENHPLLDDEAYYEVEREIEEETLPYLLMDFTDDEHDVEMLTQAYWKCREAEELTFVVEAATSGYITTSDYTSDWREREVRIKELLHARCEVAA